VGTIRGVAMSGSEDVVTIEVLYIGWNDKRNVPWKHVSIRHRGVSLYLGSIN